MAEWTRLRPVKEVDLEIPISPSRIGDGRGQRTAAGAACTTGSAATSEPAVEAHLTPGAMEALERAAVDILSAHEFPHDRDLGVEVVWAWTGTMLVWSARPRPDSPCEAPAELAGAQLIDWSRFRQTPEYRRHWPAWSPFDWAEHVCRFRQARIRAFLAGDLTQAWAAGTALGVYLGHHRYWENHLADWMSTTSVGSVWKRHALPAARELRTADPSLGHTRLARALANDERLRQALKAAKRPPPTRDQMVAVIRAWESEWRADQETGLRPSTRNPELRR
jgi:hypothetical protein